ncbi:DUF418 domain-containing protein [Promicromonospora sp. MEB111]|uniref:DUF418 domain-containing protein n=1 Tax=Promicromonospora sp. MEB111 TaxID=3040301 RepID=UPI0025508D55|nr:DUF418 domain-containing protein [Promicromonospora sp. MEB111]
MNAPGTALATRPTTGTRQRWRFIDSLRGFAVLGILLVNAVDITWLGMARVMEGGAPVQDPVLDALYLTVQTRFVPIFVFLFGISLWIVLDGARARAPRPWLVTVRRLVGLAIIGGLLMFVYPGNVLVEYGIVGLLMLPVVALTPRWVTLAGGAALTIVAYAVFGGGLASVPGLILLGAGAAAYGLPRALESSGRAVAIVFASAAVLTGPALFWQLTTSGGDPRFSTAGSVAGLVMAVLYTTGLALLWRTRARRAITAFFEPLGHMALTNYVGAAIVVALIALVVDFGHMTSAAPVVVLALVLTVVQAVLSWLWLRHFVYGPVEWLWRTATWLRPASMRRRIAATESQ